MLAAVAVLGSATSGASAAEVNAPDEASPGDRIEVTATGFPPDSRVRVQFGRYFAPPRNCCVSLPSPRVGAPGFLIPSSGSRTFRIRVPKAYVMCVGIYCGEPSWVRYRRGERIYVSVTSSEVPGESYARALLRVG